MTSPCSSGSESWTSRPWPWSVIPLEILLDDAQLDAIGERVAQRLRTLSTQLAAEAENEWRRREAASKRTP